MTTTATGRLPAQIPYIIGNEACERFSFYGMRNILTEFLVVYLLLDIADEEGRKLAAKEIFHTFVIGVYFFPLLGGWIADRFAGKYATIFWLSLVYVVGHLCLAVFEGHKTGFYVGLFLIALGSGGIKPCVSAFVGDQFDQSNKHLAKVVFDAFYWSLSVTVGNLWVLLANAGVKNETVTTRVATLGIGVTAFQMFFFAAFALVAAAMFGLYATQYRPVDFYRREASA